MQMEVGSRSKVTLAPTYYRYKQSPPLTEQLYRDAMENAANYNSRISAERRQRLPFLDSQTGLAQNHSNLFMPYRYRSKGLVEGQLYSYPAKRWRKKKRTYSQVEVAKVAEVETGEADMHQISAVENPAAFPPPEMNESNSQDVFKEMQWYDDYDPLGEPPDAGEIDDPNSDSSDYEETYKRRKKKKGGRGTRGRSKRNADKELSLDREIEKPYSCDTCGARYKTRPGLNYHLSHNHISAFGGDESNSPSPKLTPPPTPEKKTRDRSERETRSAETGKGVSVNDYCDFCLGDAVENKKTGTQEELVSCADCGRSGHPSCLQFTPNMIISVKKYPWQCIECKSCGLCGTSDNDDQLLFCDDCDRGYHMYCLNPPLSEPPEGSWSCHLCIVEFHGGKTPDHMKDQ